MGGLVSEAKWISSAATESTPTKAASMTTATTGTTSSGTTCRHGSAIQFRPQSKCLAQPQVQRKQTGGPPSIDGRNGLAGNRHRIECAPGRVVNGAALPGRGSNRGPIIEDRVAVQVLTDDDIKRRAGLRDNERIQPKTVLQRDAAPKHEAVANIKAGASPVFHGIVRVHDECSRGRTTSKEAAASTAPTTSTQIAIGEVQRIESKQRNPRSHVDAKIGDQLVLQEGPFGVVLVDVRVAAKRPHIAGRISPRQGCIGIAQEELVLPARVQIGNRKRGAFRDLPLHAEGGLQGVARLYVRSNLIDGGRRLRKLPQDALGRDQRIEERLGHNVL